MGDRKQPTPWDGSPKPDPPPKPPPKQTVDLQDLKRRLEALSPAHRLLVASQLMADGKCELAVTIAEAVVVEYQAAKLLQR